jgi:hypothetical protein
VWRAWSQRRLRAETVDRLLAAVLLAWALFDVPWWWRPPGHGGSAPVILGVIVLAAAQSVPFFGGGGNSRPPCWPWLVQPWRSSTRQA